jgi:hypothetical protein
LQIVIKTAVIPHQIVERAFTAVAERAVADVVCKRDGGGQILVHPQGPGQGACHLGHFHGMGEAGAVMILGADDKHLGFVFQTTKATAVDHPVAVALEIRPPGGLRLRVQTPPRVTAPGRIGGQSGLFK